MNTLSYKTISVNKETAKKEWVVIDATDQVVGRLCSKVAKLIRGKYKPSFTPNVDCGDNVIIINAAKAVFSGKKETDKVYTRYTGYPGGQRFNTPAELRKRPDGMDKIIRHAVKGMLPKGPLGRRLLDNLYIYDGTEHKHEAQQPKAIDINQYAVARVYLTEGTGKITINKVELAKYFPSAILQYVVKQPLQLLGVEEKYDIKCNLDGGGFTGQSQALRLAIARALVKVDAEDKKTLKVQGFLTRDAREVERKKPGQPKARRRFQFSKR